MLTMNTIAEGEHERRRRLEGDMGSPERHIEVIDGLNRFARINAGHSMKVVMQLGGPTCNVVVAVSKIVKVKGLIDRGELTQNGKPSSLSASLIKILLSSLSQNLPELKGITEIGASTFYRLFRGTKILRSV